MSGDEERLRGIFSFIFLLFLWIIVLTVSLLVFTKKGMKGTGLHPETKGD